MVATNWHLPDANNDQLTDSQLDAVRSIEKAVESHVGLKHPLWEWIATGSFDLDQLRAFAGMYYGHVRQFRKYLAGAITVSSVEPLQEALAEILAEEYGRRFDPKLGDFGPSHPELYRRFMRSIGMNPEDWHDELPIPGIRYYHSVIYDLFRGDRELEVMGAIIFGMEASTPYRHERVTAGIEKFCETSDLEIDHTFFNRHVEIDPRHGQSIIMPIREWLDDPGKVAALTRGAITCFEARAFFLDDLQRRINEDA